MSVRAVGVNSAVLRWGRESAGITIDEIADTLGRPRDEVQSWESSASVPTFSQLERLAKAYHRPIGVFFFPVPPKEDFREEFRTLPQSEFESLLPDTRLALREAKAYQISLGELAAPESGRRLITEQIRPSPTETPSDLATRVRQYLGASLKEQQAWHGAVEAFKAWRELIEASGVYVFKRPFDQESISGFCLHDEKFPLIMINNSTAHTRQAFTLFHELGHLLYGFSGITTTDLQFEQQLAPDAKHIEVKVNQFAAEVLVPSESFPWSLVADHDLIQATQVIASNFNVSREVVLRKLFDAGRVDQETYLKLSQQWIQEAQAARSSTASGGNYYANQATYLSNSFTSLGFDQLRAGKIGLTELSEHFGMKAPTLLKFEKYLLERRAS